MNIERHIQAEYAIPAGTPALQVNPQRFRRRYALSVLTLVLLAAGIGYLLGRFQAASTDSVPRVAAMDTFR